MMAEVPVIGAGPGGLRMAAELARHGAACRSVDRRDPAHARNLGRQGIARAMIDARVSLDGMRSIIAGRRGQSPIEPGLVGHLRRIFAPSLTEM